MGMFLVMCLYTTTTGDIMHHDFSWWWYGAPTHAPIGTCRKGYEQENRKKDGI
jgi:hypothetical protein